MGFVRRYAPEAAPETHPELDALIGHALAISATSSPARSAGGRRTSARRGVARARRELAGLAGDASAEEIQTEVYEVGKAHPFESLRDWFKAQYEILLGTSQGPRMGSFIALYGLDNSRRLIAEALAAEAP